VSAHPGRVSHQRDVALVDIVDRVLNRGIVVTGDITLALADVDLVYVNLRLLLASVPTVLAEGADDPSGGDTALGGCRNLGDAYR
jgi:gas vesicle structural protein